MYQNILCLLGNGQDADQVLARACAARDHFRAKLFLLTVVDFLPVTGAEDAMLSTPLVMADELQKQAQTRMRKFATSAGLEPGNTAVVQGELAQEAGRCAQDWQIDLIVLGKHERSGLSSWFNHAEDDVLHGCPCDLLAVHLCDQ